MSPCFFLFPIFLHCDLHNSSVGMNLSSVFMWGCP
jgi:hypothetical protein